MFQKALEVGIACFNVESDAELDRIQKVAAKLGNKSTHFIARQSRCRCENASLTFQAGLKENKFGIPSDTVFETYPTRCNAAEFRHYWDRSAILVHS